MVYVLEHKDPDRGLFVGICLGLAFFANYDNAGQNEVVTFSSIKAIEDFCKEVDWVITEFTIHEVKDGHYSTLKNKGINVGFLEQTHFFKEEYTQ